MAALASATAAACAQNVHTWTQLSRSTAKVDEFQAAHPESDGRGVVIAVLDTGVDPSIPGLTRTPDGQVKVIDLQDFTGQGDLELHRIRLDGATGKLIDHDADGVPIEYVPPTVAADLRVGREGVERRWWFATLDEKRFINSEMPDLNDNGSTEDKFAVCVTALPDDGDDDALCFIDTNLDRSFADEKPLRNYRVHQDTFTLFREKPEKQIVPVAFSINVFLKQAKVVVHYDDGAHGTHVAGIAAGYRINEQEGLNGIAPGAKVIGLKIGQNAIGGGTTTESIKLALEYAARYAREHDVPVVCNMSFGVESTLEGKSDIDQVVEDILRQNPYLVFCTSAGNEGPGLSSVGTPAAALSAITVGALLAADTARDVMGFTMPDAVVTVFSSRGGELDKPDVAAPGWSTSTVPRWIKGGDYWSGTSMASPYVAGLCAVLLSDAQARHPGVHVRTCDLRQALRLSARALPGATPPDMGWGLPDLPKAAELLDTLIAAAKDDPVIGYDLSTHSAHTADGQAPVAHWRGTYFPTEERIAFTIKPIFAPTTDASARTSFVRPFDLRCDVPWIKLPQEQIYLRGEQVARVFVEYDATKLTEPGFYVGAVEALHDGRPAFRLVNSVVVPYRFTAADGFARTFKDRTVYGWTPDRYFLSVPPGASAMQVTLKAPDNQESLASIERIFDPTGARFRRLDRKLDTPTGVREVTETFAKDLTPGIWEVPVVADRPDKQWPYELTVRFFGLHAAPATITAWSGSPPSGELHVTNLFETPLAADASGALEGFRLAKDDKFKGLKDELSYSIDLDERFERLRIDLEMTPEAYATTTDIGVSVEDAEGKAVFTDHFSNRTVRATVPTGGAGSLKVVIRAGFATADDQRETPIAVRIDRLLAQPVPIKVTRGDASSVRFLPGVPMKVGFALSEPPPEAPEGTQPVGYLRFTERADRAVALEVPIEIAP